MRGTVGLLAIFPIGYARDRLNAPLLLAASVTLLFTGAGRFGLDSYLGL
jgi:hypothetical protein